MKKNLQLAVLALALCCVTANAQNKVVMGNSSTQAVNVNNQPANNTIQLNNIINRGCGTGVPSQQWEEEFEKQVAAFVAEREKQNINGKTQMPLYTIPVIIHVIHGGQAIGTFPNLSVAQCTSQITVLNQDYAGTGFNVGNYPATAFQTYATNTVVSAASKDASLRIKVANCQVQFCLATKDTTGATLAQPGIDRINYISKGWTNPTTFTSPSTFMSYFDGTIKPGSIWNCRKYLNIWISDENASMGLLGYATFAPGTSLSVYPGPFGTATTDGVWCYSAAFGSAGIAAGSYATGFDRGRSATHEIGHWLGLRHIGGDVSGGCGNDGCNDTPPNAACGGTCGNGFGQNYGAPTYPFHVNLCPGPPANVNGDMFMNYMDYTDDAVMYMFTVDQANRMQTAMSQSPYRNALGTHGLCTVGANTPAIAAFTMTNTSCNNTPVTVTNNSTGNPSPSYTWTASGGPTFNPNNTSPAPTITWPTAGTYTVMLTASNGTTSTQTKTITITTCTFAVACSDTLTNFKNTDTLLLYTTGAGYVVGNNQYGDKEKAEYYSSTGLVGTAKVMGGIVIFYKHATLNIGTKGTSNLVFKMFNGNNTTGPSGAPVNTFTNSITNILASSTATGLVTYCGNPGIGYATNIMRPYSFNFAVPTTITGDFLIGVQLPTVTGDTAAIFESGPTLATSTAWEMQSNSVWYPFSSASAWSLKSSAAILPKIACVTDVYNVNGISGNIAIFPNPSNGVFNFAITMPKASDLNFTVINSIGQLVYSKVEKDITNSIVSMDLSHLSKGIYFVNIIDSTGDKVTKKLIIN